MIVEFRSPTPQTVETAPKTGEKSIREEPMLFGASIDFAYKEGGMLTRQVLNHIRNQPGFSDECFIHASKGYHPVIDTKSVMLMPGFYPCIPGWHCDGVIRKDGESQPDLSTLNEDIYHYTCVLSSNPDQSETEFLNENVSIDIDENAVWQSVDKDLEKRSLNVLRFKSGDIVRFRRSNLHKCPPANQRQWRYFFRISFYHMPAMNQIRNQVQVYIDKNQGW